MPLLVLLMLLLPAAPQSQNQLSHALSGRPAISSQGLLCYSEQGDLWIAQLSAAAESGPPAPAARARRLTSGAAWDHQPAWTADGRSVIFSSDRDGQFDLWSIAVENGGPAGQAVRLTEDPSPEGFPSTAGDGSIVFSRGRGAESDLWLRKPDGSLSRLTDKPGAETEAAVTADGRLIAYISIEKGKRSLRLLEPGSQDEESSDRKLIDGLPAEYPAWSPQDDRILFTARGRRAGVWITDLEASYTNLLSREPAAAAWFPDGRRLLLSALPPAGPGYNGDPDRLGGRLASDRFPSPAGLWTLPAPDPPDERRSWLGLGADEDRQQRNSRIFKRVSERLQRLYYPGEKAAQWKLLEDTFYPQAVAAASDQALEEILHDMLQRRPAIGEEASGSAAVSSAHPLATQAGIGILRQGGNLVDAAVAVSFALGVVEPDASGLGGYGQMLIHQQGMDEPVVIEFLTRVPEEASLGNASLLEDGRLPSDGPVLANVPGTVAGMGLAWKKYGSGKVEWAQLLEPAIGLARQGFVLDEAFPTTLQLERERYLQYEGSRKLFFPQGEPLQAGDRLQNPGLAWTLEQIAQDGAEAFYQGEIARRMVADLRGQGNAMTLHDLRRYYAVERTPVQGTYRGHTLYSSAPASSGGAALIAKLNLLEQVENPGAYSRQADTLHAMIEAWKLAPSTRGRIADPGLWPVDLTPFVDKAAAARLWQSCFDPQKSSGPDELKRDKEGRPACSQQDQMAFSWGELPFPDCRSDRDCRASGTTSFALADAQGNLVSVTQTLGTWGGNFYVTENLGFLYNDKLRSYGTKPGRYNARLPYARNGTSIAPTLIFKGSGASRIPWAALGAAGNAWITSAVYQMASGLIDQGLDPQQALELPRFLVSVRREDGGEGPVQEIRVQIEDGFAPAVIRRLVEMGHQVEKISYKGELRMGYGAMALVDRDKARAGADPRRSGSAAALP
ncbi:MAG: gamma-glutamyltransferase [Acidobacteriota bacterium]